MNKISLVLFINLLIIFTVDAKSVDKNLATMSQPKYIIGIVPQFEAKKLSNIWSPIISELEKRTGFKLNFMGSPRIPEFEKSFLAGEFDFAYMNPYHLIVARKQQGYIPLIRDGKRKLFGIIAVHKDSKYKTPEDLNGLIIAFPAPNALGASLMIRAALTEKFKISFTPLYSQTHSSSYLNVLLKRASAAGGVKGTFLKQKDHIKDNLKIIYETEKVAPHPLAAHPRVPEAHRNIFMKEFLKLSQEDAWADQLKNIPMMGAVEASIDDYLPLEKLHLENFYVK